MVKIPSMSKEEYDNLIKETHVSRIAFLGGDYPYIAPFMYVFDEDEKFLYFLSTKYGKKIDLINKNPHVAVEIEKYSHDMSQYKFITLQGKITEVKNENEKMDIKAKFVDKIKNKLSNTALAALGYSPDETPQSIMEEERILLWKLVDVEKIVALKNP